MVDSDRIVPIGKYKGQPVEILAQDQKYLDWLTAQAWFRERYANFYTLIINNFREPSETPEHNSLQALFLDDGFCWSVISAAYPTFLTEFDDLVLAKKDRVRKSIDESRERTSHELLRTRDQLARNLAAITKLESRLNTHADFTSNVLKEMDSNKFERGSDVLLCVTLFLNSVNEDIYGYSRKNTFCVEIKPSVSDDYPAVLRQMRASRMRHPQDKPILFTTEYTGVGVSESQFVQIFESSRISVVFKDRLPVC